jgi:quinohemoprotein ethanol dehydrogenase
MTDKETPIINDKCFCIRQEGSIMHIHCGLKSFLYMAGVAALLTWTALGQQPGRVDDSVLRDAPKTGKDWLSYGLDLAETRYSVLKQIDTTNVHRLGLAWSYEVGAGGSIQEATPLAWNGTIFGITNWSITFAVDARTGKERWRWDPQVDRDAARPAICCGVVNRGIALYDGKIMVPVIDGRLVALDADKGKVIWQAQVSSVENNYTLTMAPRIAGGKVIIGVAGGEYGNRGYFDAYDAKTGKRVWRFYTVPGDPSKPFENEAMRRASKTWSGEFWKMGGGGPVWDGTSYDAEADLVYVATGNGAPWPEELRQSKGMDNLYINSILAVEGKTGQLKWYFQTVPGDWWDYDGVQQMTLADITIDGKKRKVLMQATKGGFFYVLDRTTGEFISGDAFAAVTWARGLDPKTGRPLVNSEAYYGSGPVTLMPSTAHNWAAMSFNPTTGLVYIPATLFSSYAFLKRDEFVYKPGKGNFNTGIILGGRRPAPAAGAPPAAKQPAKDPAHDPGAAGTAAPAPPAPALAAPPTRKPSVPAIGPKQEEIGQSGSVLLAWDPVAQKERWRTPGGGGAGGGCLTTAGNLVIQVIPDGRLVAYSADKGQKLFEVQTGLRRGMGAPITYEIDGKQYISLMGGMGVTERYGLTANNPPPPPPSPSTIYPRLLTFVLDGKAQLPDATAAP